MKMLTDKKRTVHTGDHTLCWWNCV